MLEQLPAVALAQWVTGSAVAPLDLHTSQLVSPKKSSSRLLKFGLLYSRFTATKRPGTFLCAYGRPIHGYNKKKHETIPQNEGFPPTLPKKKKKPYPIRLKKIQQAARDDKKLAEMGIEKHLEPPKNGILVPDLIPVAYEVIDAWKVLIGGVAQLLHVIPVQACSFTILYWFPQKEANYPFLVLPVSSADVEDVVNPHHPGYKWRLTIAYDDTRFSGWQYQKSIPTVQCVVEQALTRVTKLEMEDLQLVGAGRTDAGVHAYGQVAHFVTPFKYDSLGGFHKAINLVNEKEDPFHRHYAFHSAHKLNAAAMCAAAKYFVGSHDYSAFSNVSRNDRVPNPVKNIIRFDVNEMGPLLQLEVEGSGNRQVWNMFALLLQVGREALPPEIVPKILASRDRKELAKFSFFVPPHGLCLLAIKYHEDHLCTPSDCPVTSLGMHYTITKCKHPYY